MHSDVGALGGCPEPKMRACYVLERSRMALRGRFLENFCLKARLAQAYLGYKVSPKDELLAH